jgi:hypothetical protein
LITPSDKQRGTYKLEAGFKLWKRYLAGGVSRETVFNLLEKYVSSKAGKAARKRGIYGSLQGEEAIQRVRIKLWEAIRKKRLPSDSVPGFHAYLITIASREVWDYAKFRKKEYHPELVHGAIRRSNPRLDEEMLLGDLPLAIRRRVGASILGRFPEASPEATRHVLDHVLCGETLSRPYLQRKHHIQEPRFFIESILIATRMALYELREDVYPLSKTMSGTPYESFVDHL